jgi:hypothetical protein
VATKHPGFAAVQSKIAKQQGIPKARAGAILAASSRNASKAAKRKNPRLKKVGGTPRDALARQMVDQDKRKAAGSQRKMLPARRFGGNK